MVKTVAQQTFLRHAMKSLRMTRKQFAERLGIKQRRLDSWLLPVGSPELRGLDASTRLLIEKLLRREELLANSRLVVVDQPCDVPPIVCPHGVKFPPIYRLTGYGYVLNDDGKSIVDGAVGELLPPAYLLVPSDKSGRQAACVERITRLDPAIDSGWLVVRRQRSLEALEGYIDAVLDVTDESFLDRFDSAGVETVNGAFTLLHRPPRPGTPDCLIIYASMCPAEVGSPAANLLQSHGGTLPLVDCITVVSSSGEIIDPALVYPQGVD